MSENEKRAREACFFDGILAASYENMQSAKLGYGVKPITFGLIPKSSF